MSSLNSQYSNSVWPALFQQKILHKGVVAGLIVGSILLTINQWEWLAGQAPLDMLKMVLTFIVPYYCLCCFIHYYHQNSFTFK